MQRQIYYPAHEREWYPIILCLFVWGVFFVFYLNLPQTGVFLSAQQNGKTDESVYPRNYLDLTPSQMMTHLQHEHYDTISIQSYIHIKNNPRQMAVYVDHGDAEVLIDGIPVETFSSQSPTRIIYTPYITPGFHLLEIRCENVYPIPRITVTSKTKESNLAIVSQGFYPTPILLSSTSILILHSIFITTFLFGAGMLTVILNPKNYRTSIVVQFSPLSMWVSILIPIVIGMLYYSFLFFSPTMYEGDEAAFWIALLLKQFGTSIPWFHFGQEYQGMLELIPVKLLTNIFGESTLLPFRIWNMILKILFIIFGSCLFYRYGNRWMLILFLFYFSCCNPFYHWVSSKVWFGYSINMVLVFVLCWTGFQVLGMRYNKIALFIFYVLCSCAATFCHPISAPVVIAMLVFWLPEDVFICVDCLQRYLLRPVCIPVFACIFIAGFLFLGTVEWQRLFLEKVIFLFIYTLAIQPIYDYSYPSVFSFFVFFPVSLTVGGMIVYFFFSERIAQRLNQFSHQRVRLFLLMLMVGYGFILCRNPNYMQPWHVSPVLFCIPLFFYSLFLYLYLWRSSLFYTVLLLWILTLLCTKQGDLRYWMQESSLSASGLVMSNSFEEVFNSLNDHQINVVLSDQGYDNISLSYSGRDWIGDRILAESQLAIVSANRYNRRWQSMSEQLMHEYRIAYLFHRDFHFQHPIMKDTEESLFYSKMNLEELFGPSVLNFERILCGSYILYIPHESIQRFYTSLNQVSTSDSILSDIITDRHLQLRNPIDITNFESKQFQISLHFDPFHTIQTIVIFHGAYWRKQEYDSLNIRLDSIDLPKQEYDVNFYESSRTTVVRIQQPVNTQNLQIGFEQIKNLFAIQEVWCY